MRKKRKFSNIRINNRVKIVNMEYSIFAGFQGKEGKIVAIAGSREKPRYQILFDDAPDPRYLYWFDAREVEKL